MQVARLGGRLPHRFALVFPVCFLLLCCHEGKKHREKALVSEPSVISLKAASPETPESFSFTVRNKSRKPIELIKVISHCGCAKSRLPSKTNLLPAGGSVTLSGLFQREKLHPVQFSALEIIYKTEGKLDYLTVPVMARVQLPFSTAPRKLYFRGSVAQIQEKIFEIGLFGDTAAGVTIEEVQFPQPAFQIVSCPAVLPPATHEGDSSTGILRFKLRRDVLLPPRENITGSITIQVQTVASSKREVVDVPIQIEVVPRISLVPQFLHIGDPGFGVTSFTRMFRVEGTSETLLSVRPLGEAATLLSVKPLVLGTDRFRIDFRMPQTLGSAVLPKEIPLELRFVNGYEVVPLKLGVYGKGS